MSFLAVSLVGVFDIIDVAGRIS